MGVIPCPPRCRPPPIDEALGCAVQPESAIVMCVWPQRRKKFVWRIFESWKILQNQSINQATKSARDWFLFQQLQYIKLLTSEVTQSSVSSKIHFVFFFSLLNSVFALHSIRYLHHVWSAAALELCSQFVSLLACLLVCFVAVQQLDWSAARFSLRL
jgi:hypothetical protein